MNYCRREIPGTASTRRVTLATTTTVRDKLQLIQKNLMLQRTSGLTIIDYPGRGVYTYEFWYVLFIPLRLMLFYVGLTSKNEGSNSGFICTALYHHTLHHTNVCNNRGCYLIVILFFAPRFSITASKNNPTLKYLTVYMVVCILNLTLVCMKLFKQ